MKLARLQGVLSGPQLPGHLVALFAGAFIPLATAPMDIWPLAFIAPALWLFTLNTVTPGLAALRGWLFGMGLFGTGASWVQVSIHQFGGASEALSIALTLLFVTGLALFTALHGWLWRRWLKQTPILLTFPALWVLMEAFRGWFLTGFPWLYLGTTQTDTWLANLAPLIGVNGISGVIVLISLLAARTLWLSFPTLETRLPRGYRLTDLLPHPKCWLAPTALIGILLITLAIGPIQWTHPVGQPLTIGLVQPDIPQEEKWERRYLRQIVNRYWELSRSIKPVDVLIWPETALPLEEHQAYPVMAEALRTQAPHTTLITGTVSQSNREGTRRFRNTVVTADYDQKLNITGHYYKNKLVPFGEYVPLESLLRGLISFFDLPMSSFIPGPDDQPLLTVGDTLMAPLICYEVAYSGYAARQAQDAQWLLTVSNDSWFGRSAGPLQHFQIARFRALETGKPLVRVTNNGLTAVINPKGQVDMALPRFETKARKTQLQPYEGMTPYSRWGAYPVYLISALLILWGWHQRLRATLMSTETRDHSQRDDNTG